MLLYNLACVSLFVLLFWIVQTEQGINQVVKNILHVIGTSLHFILLGAVVPSFILSTSNLQKIDWLSASNEAEYQHIQSTFRAEGTPFPKDYIETTIDFIILDIDKLKYEKQFCSEDKKSYQLTAQGVGFYFLPTIKGVVDCGQL